MSSREVGRKFSASSMISTTSSRGMVEMRERYETDEPSLRCAIFLMPSMRTTVLLNEKRSFGSVVATAFQIPPVPSRAGKRNVALGPLECALW
jgi:hypothetical protein